MSSGTRPGASGGGSGKAGRNAKGAGRPSPREVALDILVRVEQEDAYSNLLLNSSLQKAALPREDAGLATELVYGTITRLNTLDYILKDFVNKGVSKLQPWVRSLLRLSLYQIVYLDRIPPHAAVNEAVNIAKKRGHQGISGMVNGVLRSVLRAGELPSIPEGLPEAERIALQHSHPLWLVQRWISQFGAATAEEICRADNEPPLVSVRVNTTMLSRDRLLEEMKLSGLDAAPSRISPYGVVVRGGGNLALSEWYKEGQLSIQDESSMLVAEAVAPSSGMAVLDCCAAPGGKTAHMAELMKDDGFLYANDLHEHKARLVAEGARRLGLGSVQVGSGDASQLPSRFEEASFDRILLDAPCTGLGVIRRKPDLKWKKTEGDISDISAVQMSLLESVSALLKPGGILVYSTCTLEHEENGGIVSSFLERHPEFAPEPFPEEMAERLQGRLGAGGAEVQLLPQDFGSDGFYIARLRRNPSC